MSKSILEIDDDAFEAQVIQSDKPVLVDFWAPWCGPCRAIAPAIEELEGVYGDRMKFVKVNVDDNPITPSKFGIKAIPTLIFFKNGEAADQITGMVPRAKLEEAVKKLV